MWIEIIKGGFYSLGDYIGKHVLTCLIPAFLLAGGIVSFISKETILKYLGETRSKIKSFTLSSFSSFFVAACSCTVIPVSSGLYYAGAGIGTAFIILWVAPSSNILALTYTGSILGGKIALARLISSIIMAYIVGMVMSLSFPEKREFESSIEGKEVIIKKKELILLILILLSLLLPNYLIRGGKYIYKVIVWFILTLVFVFYAFKSLEKEKIKNWLKESWWFVKIILPLLLVGVFIVGIIGKVLPETWIKTYLGGNSLRANFLATIIGSISYFATMTEAPFVDTLMKLGMGKGPALALLLTGPGLSLPNWLAIGRVFGFKKALVYVPLLIFLGTFVGYIYGKI